MIEAKYRTRGAVGINDISNSVNAARTLLGSQTVKSAVIITNTSFTAEAKSSVMALANIQLLTLHDLQQQLFNSSESLLRSVSDYSTSKLSAEYIALSATSYSTAKRTDDIAKHLHYKCTYDGTPLVLLGDFGSGKTTILERVFIECAKDRLRESKARFPVFLRLRSLRQHLDLWSFIASNLRDHQYISPPKHVFESQLKSGRLIVFLDGFDEIYSGASISDRGKFLAQLYPLINSPSPCVISSRPTYFTSVKEMVGILSSYLDRERPIDRTPNDFKVRSALGRLRNSMGLGGAPRVTPNLFDDIWVIDQLNEKAIVEYISLQESMLKAVTGKTAIEIRRFLDLVYDLKDLMRRPLLLRMVVQSILNGLIDISNADIAIGPSTLYEAYTQLSFHRDSEKRGAGSLSADARRVVCQHLSLTMTQTGSAELSHIEVRRCIVESGVSVNDVTPEKDALAFRRRERDTLDEHAIESILTDIRLGSFLSFGREGTLRFAHKSYMEFFVAQFIYQSALADPNAASPLDKLSLGREVVYFLGSYARDFADFGRWIAKRAQVDPHGSVGSRESALRALLASGLLSKTRVSDATIRDVELRKAKITEAKLENLRLHEVTISDLSANAWSISHCVLEECDISSIVFSESNIELEIRNSSLVGITLTKGKLVIGGKGWTLDSSYIKHATVQLKGIGIVGGARFENCDLHLATEGKVGHRFQAHRCTITSNRDASSFQLGTGVIIRSCFVVGLILPVGEVISLLRPQRDASEEFNDLPLDASSEGVIFVNTQGADENLIAVWEFGRASLSIRFPKLEFYDLQLYQRAIAVSGNRRMRATKRSATRSRTTSHVPEGSDADAIAVARRLYNALKDKGWLERPAAETLVAELKAGGFA